MASVCCWVLILMMRDVPSAFRIKVLYIRILRSFQKFFFTAAAGLSTGTTRFVWKHRCFANAFIAFVLIAVLRRGQCIMTLSLMRATFTSTQLLNMRRSTLLDKPVGSACGMSDVVDLDRWRVNTRQVEGNPVGDVSESLANTAAVKVDMLAIFLLAYVLLQPCEYRFATTIDLSMRWGWYARVSMLPTGKSVQNVAIKMLSNWGLVFVRGTLVVLT